METIAFCQTIKDRYYQAEKVVPHNMKIVKNWNDNSYIFTNSQPELEVKFIFVIVDFNCPNKSSERLREKYTNEDCLYVMDVKEDTPWHFAKMKNCAHRLAIKLGADYVVNLDIDNFVSYDELFVLARAAYEDWGVHFWQKQHKDGTYGRIGLSSKTFLKFGGYNETTPPGGVHDMSLVWLMEKSKDIELIKYKSMYGAVKNPKSETLKYIGDSEQKYWEDAKSYKDYGVNLFMRKWTGQLWQGGKGDLGEITI